MTWTPVLSLSGIAAFTSQFKSLLNTKVSMETTNEIFGSNITHKDVLWLFLNLYNKNKNTKQKLGRSRTKD